MLLYETTHALAEALSRPRLEVVPLRGITEQVSHLPRSITITVTCSPSGGIEPTLATVEELSRMGFDAVPHISARTVTGPKHLDQIVTRLETAGVRNIYAIGGDGKTPLGPYPSAGSLLEALHEVGNPFDEIGVAAYPEGHPLIHEDHLWQVLRRKQEMATYLVTQMCFDATTITGWLQDARERGITLPAFTGIPGVVSWIHLLRIATKIGVGESSRFLGRHSGMFSRMIRPGDYAPDELLDGLFPALADPWLDIRGLHIYSFNYVHQTDDWRQRRLADTQRI